jgi:hypothetical protein
MMKTVAKMSNPTYLISQGGIGIGIGTFIYSLPKKRRVRNMKFNHHNNLKPIIVNGFCSRGIKLSFKSPVEFAPSRNRDGDLWVIDEPKYSLHVFAATRELLKKEIEQAFEMMWQVFVVEGDRKLTPKAANLRRVLREEIVPEGLAVGGAQ